MVARRLPVGLLLAAVLAVTHAARAQPPEIAPPAEAGATRWLERSSPPDAAWRGRLVPARRGWLLVELDGPPRADLDLLVRGEPDGPRAARSHLARERLVVATASGEPLELVVPHVHGEGPVDFRLGLTLLGAPDALAPGEELRGRLAAGHDRARLVELAGRRGGRCRLRLEGTAAPGGTPRGAPPPPGADLDLVVLDARLDAVALGVAPGAEETCSVELRPGARSWGLLVAVEGEARYTLRLERAREGSGPPRLGRFLDDLARSPEQRKALRGLRRNPDFLRMRAYLERAPDGLPLKLRVVPGLRARGAERFGTYSRGTLTINPAIDAHATNVQELVDTLVHELIHALLDLPRRPGFPLAADVTDAAHDPRLRGLSGRRLVRGAVPEPYGAYLRASYGPSASDPEHGYTDINAAAQRLVVKVVRDNMRRTGLGRETLVFENVRDRRARRRGAGEDGTELR